MPDLKKTLAIAKLLRTLKLIGATAEKNPEPDLAKARWLLVLTSQLARHTAEEVEEELA
jgi:hypothetical protein